MAKIKLIDLSGKVVNEIEVNKNLVVDKPHTQALFETVIAENASRRQGTHSTLTKGEVRGGGRKPYAQKHTGNARQGSIRNPHYVGGGVVFGPKPNRNYLVKVNRKIVKLALASAFTLKINKENVFALIDEVKLDKPKTKTILLLLKELKLIGKKSLFILNAGYNVNLFKSIRNINRVNVKTATQVSPQDIMHANVVFVQQNALSHLAKVVA